MDFLTQVHSFGRWLVLLAGVGAAVKYAVGLARHSTFMRLDRILGAVYSGLLDAQALVGLTLLVGLAVEGDGLPPNRILHAGIMFFAVAAAHQTARWREAPDERKFRNGLIAYGLSLVLILLGIVVILRVS